MSFDRRSLVVGVCVGMILVGVVGLVNARSLHGRIDGLEEAAAERDSVIGELVDDVEMLEGVLASKDAAFDLLETELEESRVNASVLAVRVAALELNNTEMAAEIKILDEAIWMIGDKEMETLLREYTNVSLAYEGLQREYDELLSEYNKLLNQVP
ncbi:hypothetical protein JXL21_03985 [Candidatus Bathyarchaeota archaeon]|nr:hypothetical protein [Candidatus Bathyarchaeota archaeon]